MLVISALVCVFGSASSPTESARTAKSILHHQQKDPSRSAVADVASLGKGGVSLRNSDKTPPGPASQQEVMVQYESLCPDTVVFFADMQKTYADETFRNRFTFELIPYGNVKLPADKKLDNTKPWGGRICQHGERECWGNAWQACTHALISDKSRIMKHSFCLMDLPKQGMPEKYWGQDPWSCGDYKQCVVDRCDDGTLTAQERADVETCVGKVRKMENSQGTMEMDSHQKAAELWNISHVPWIVVNGLHVQKLDDNKISLSSYLQSLPEPQSSKSLQNSQESASSSQDAQTKESASSSQDAQTEDQPIVTGQESDDSSVDNPPPGPTASQNAVDRKGSERSTTNAESSHDAGDGLKGDGLKGPEYRVQSPHKATGQMLATASVVLLLGASMAMYCAYKRNLSKAQQMPQ